MNHHQPRRDRYRGGPAPSRQQAPVATASTVRVANIEKLAQALGGAHALGIRLDMGIGRLQELMAGINFSDETAFHIEVELGLAPGWLSDKHATAPDRQRLESLASEAAPAANAPAVSSAAQAQAVAALEPELAMAGADASTAHAAPRSTPRARPTKHPEPPPSAALAAKTVNPAQPTAFLAPLSVASTLPIARKEPSMSNTVQDHARTVRVLNLELLTSEHGMKGRLAKVLNKTPANISHLLHGTKSFDRPAAQQIEVVLGLPLDWFESPRAEIPASAVQVLKGEVPPAASPDAVARRRGRPSMVAVPPQAELARTTAAPAVSPSKVAAPLAVASTSAAAPSAQSEARPSPAPALSEALDQVHITQGATMSRTARQLVAESEGQIGAIAEALVKTIIEKARDKRLSEKTALQLLTDVMSM